MHLAVFDNDVESGSVTVVHQPQLFVIDWLCISGQPSLIFQLNTNCSWFALFKRTHLGGGYAIG